MIIILAIIVSEHEIIRKKKLLDTKFLALDKLVENLFSSIWLKGKTSPLQPT
jgi:hypothetical protein